MEQVFLHNEIEWVCNDTVRWVPARKSDKPVFKKLSKSDQT